MHIDKVHFCTAVVVVVVQRFFSLLASEREGFGLVSPNSRYEYAKGVVVRAFDDHALDFPLARSLLRMLLSVKNGWSAILR